jgi:hypothetical protein
MKPLDSGYPDFCPVCEEMAVLRWCDSDLDEQICEECAEHLVHAEYALSRLNLDHPSRDLIERNP